MSTLFRTSKFRKTLYTSANGTSYEVEDVIILKDGKEWIREGAYEVFDGGIDLGIDVVRRLKIDTGLKNKDKVFITKADKQSVWNDNTVYDMYIDNSVLELKEIKKELYNVQTTIGTETTYRTEKYNREFTHFTMHESETMDLLNEQCGVFSELSDKYISYHYTLKDIKTHAAALVASKEKIDNLIEKAKLEVLEEL